MITYQQLSSLWENPAFIKFVDDLVKMKGIECHLEDDIKTLRLLYENWHSEKPTGNGE